VYSWWELAFKAVTGGPFGAYDLFMSNDTRNTDNMAAQQLTNQTLDHYKSDVINDWQNSCIFKVRYLRVFKKLLSYHFTIKWTIKVIFFIILKKSEGV
jgi:hypothetical protein